jgi:ABC-type sugar transport system permease subunit
LTIMKRKKRILSYTQKKNNRGYVFIIPWLIGVTAFFIFPIINAVTYVFGKIKITTKGIDYKFVGLENINEVFFRDPDNIRIIFETIGASFGTVLIVLIFSMFASIILNQNFKGRAIVRAIFALPVIVSSGVLLMVFKEDLFMKSLTLDPGTIFKSTELQKLLIDSGLNAQLVQSISDLVNNILDIVWKSGVQILLFLAGLQSVPRSLYEVSSVEGATPWQTFWKITFPLLSPYIVLNSVYSIIDSFTFYDNSVMLKVNSLFNELNYEYSSTLAIFYCLIVLLITAIIIKITSKKSFYIEK